MEILEHLTMSSEEIDLAEGDAIYGSQINNIEKIKIIEFI